VKPNPRMSLVAVGAACVFVLLLGVSPAAWTQQAAGSITGLVTDVSGAAVQDATVTARDEDRGTTWITKTTAAGLYEFPTIPVGKIQVKVEATGFSAEVRNSFTLVLNQVARVDFHLKVGMVNQTVTVNDIPPLLQTDSTELSTLIDANAATTLPLATRDVNQLTLLAPGVVSMNIIAFESPQTTFGTGRPIVMGGREQDNDFILDGMDSNQTDQGDVGYVPAPDALEEFNIITSNAPADYGNYIGGVVVQSIKSGTDRFHGDLYEFVRNDAFNANSWQNKATAYQQIPCSSGAPGCYVNNTVQPRPILRWNEFGGTVGGPMIKSKLFFFADVQGSLYDLPATPFANPTQPPAYLSGNFSSLCTAGFTAGICNNPAQQLYDPATGGGVPANRTPFANNQVPIRSNAAKNIVTSPLVLKSVQQPNYLQGSVIHTWQGDLRMDWQSSANDHLMGRWSQMHTQNVTTSGIDVLNPLPTREYPLKNVVFDYVHTFTPTLINEARVGFQDFPANDQTFSNPTGLNLPQVFGIPDVNDNLLPQIGFGAGAAYNLAAWIGLPDLEEKFHDTTIEAEDSLTWTRGRHSVHAGFQLLNYRMNDSYPGDGGLAGAFGFSGQFTGNGTGTVAGTSAGSGFADFLLGLPDNITAGSALTFNLRNSAFGGFVQDNYQVRSNLTLNLGARYELITPRIDADHNRNINFDKVTGGPEIGTAYGTYWGATNLQPRFGFAWQPGFAPRTVVRGAYDISNFMEGEGVNNMAVINPPNSVSVAADYAPLAYPTTTLDQGYAPFVGAQSGCNAILLATLAPGCFPANQIHETNPKLRPAVDQQWNFTIQHQFPGNSTASIAYVGNKVEHMTDLFEWNQGVVNAAGNGVLPSPYSQPLYAAGAGQVRYNDSGAVSNYEGFEATYAQKNIHGLDLQANYTFSKCLTNAQGYFGTYGDEEASNGGYEMQTVATNPFFQNMYDPWGDYGFCDTDAKSDINAYGVYSLPFGKGKQFANNVPKAVDEVIGGWQAASDWTYRTGFAITTSATDNSDTNSAAYRPDCVAGVSDQGNDQFAQIGSAIGRTFFNPKAFTLPAKYAFGNCIVGSERGPKLDTADLSVNKMFPIVERVNLLFTAQFINVTNTPIFSTPNNYAFNVCGGTCNGQQPTGPAPGAGVGTFGLVQSPDPGRQIQFALKLEF
jgi:Carboxypeptidase regulatory-like domain/TonB dependent receptor